MQTKTTERCPACFSKDLREGIAGFGDETIIVRSMDGKIYQCRKCGFDDFEEVFVDTAPPGVLSVSIMSEREETSSQN